jgi:hypothetical protein
MDKPNFFHKPCFSQREAVDLSYELDNVTIDNWVRHQHIEPIRVGSRRMFSLALLIKLDLIQMLSGMFKVPPLVAKVVAQEALDEYIRSGRAQADYAEVEAGMHWAGGRRAHDAQISFARHKDGELLPVTGDDPEEIRVDVILPVSSVARRLFDRIIRAANDAKAAEGGGADQ